MADAKKILVTGGCGFVGRHLIAQLFQEQGSEIWVVDDLSTGRHPATWDSPRLTLSHSQPYRHALVFDALEPGKRLFFVNGDFFSIAMSELGRQPGFGFPKMPSFDEVYHLASVVGGRAVIDGDPLAVGIDLAIDSSFFLWAAKINRPKRILYASSSAAYPVSKQGEHESAALSEDMIDFKKGFMQPDFTYGWSKITGEYLGRIAAEKYGLSVAVVRPFSGYGEDQDLTYPVPAIALRVAARHSPVKVWGSGDQGRDFVYIDDCVRACVLACRGISDGSAVNIGSGLLVSFKKVAAMLIELEGYSAKVEGTQNMPVGVAKRFADTVRMKAVLGFTPAISLKEGLRKVLEGAKKRLAAGILPEIL